ncbi:YafY family transcriptional regulator, partial [Mycobacterium tuberculosis]|nr:YafY family transcriptional regulator [Mycobacterium tuberculosis]
MSRSERLFDLLQALRRRRRPVSGRALADELGVSLRTLYRDIASLQGQGAEISGEPGVGYVLKPGFLLPPLMFSPEEIEALVLGSRWVAGRTDQPLAVAAGNALAKIAAVLPADLRAELETSSLLVAPSPGSPPDGVDLALLRRAIRGERRTEIVYRDASDTTSRRTVWP